MRLQTAGCLNAFALRNAGRFSGAFPRATMIAGASSPRRREQAITSTTDAVNSRDQALCCRDQNQITKAADGRWRITRGTKPADHLIRQSYCLGAPQLGLTHQFKRSGQQVVPPIAGDAEK